MVSLINDDLKANATAGKASTVDIEDWTSRISLDIIGEAGFGSTFDSLTHPFTPLNNSYRAAFVVDASSRSLFVLSMLTSPALTNLLPIKKVRDKLAGVKEVTAWVKSLIEVRKANMHMNASDENYSEKMGHKDIISTVMKGGSLSTEGLVEQSKTLLGAGHGESLIYLRPCYILKVYQANFENRNQRLSPLRIASYLTSTYRQQATGLTWAIHVLAQPENAHVQKRLREEIRSKLPSPDSGVELHSEMVDNLPYLDAVSKEMLRVYPPVPTIGRISVRDTVICGTKIPKGTLVRAFPWAINKTKHLWGEDAREFNPERWLVGKDKATGGSGEALSTITFGHGPSGCIGKGGFEFNYKYYCYVLHGC
jgi:cytochrome P450